MPISKHDWHWPSLLKIGLLLGVAVWLGLALPGNPEGVRAQFQSTVASPVPTPAPATGGATIPAEPAVPAGQARSSQVVWFVVGLAIFGPATAAAVWILQRREPAPRT